MQIESRQLVDGVEVIHLAWSRKVDKYYDIDLKEYLSTSAQACIGLEELNLEHNKFAKRWILVAGGAEEIVAWARKNKEILSNRPDEHRINRSVRVLRLDGFARESFGDRLLSNAWSAATYSSRRDQNGNIYLQRLIEYQQHLPGAEKAMELYRSILSGTAKKEDWEKIDGLLQNRRVRTIVAHLGFKSSTLAKIAAQQGLGGERELSYRWNSFLFLKPTGASYPDLELLHKTLRWATGESRDRPNPRTLVLHSTGGCAAFAVLLRRVLGSRGTYIGSGEPNMGTCGHIALRVENHICDGSGVHEPDSFIRQWCSTGGVEEIEDSTWNGDIIRRFGSKTPVMDEEEMESTLRSGLISILSNSSNEDIKTGYK